MNRRAKQAAVIFVVLLAAAQFIRPDRTNPATVPGHTIRTVVGTGNGLVAVLDRSAVQQSLLAASCSDASTGKMPGAYTLVRPQTRLSDQDVKAICAAAQTADATFTNKDAKN